MLSLPSVDSITVHPVARRAITMRLGNALILDLRDLTLDTGFIHALLL